MLLSGDGDVLSRSSSRPFTSDRQRTPLPENGAKLNSNERKRMRRLELLLPLLRRWLGDDSTDRRLFFLMIVMVHGVIGLAVLKKKVSALQLINRDSLMMRRLASPLSLSLASRIFLRYNHGRPHVRIIGSL